MARIRNKNLVFIDIIQFINSSLEKLVKNLSGNDFKYLTEEFGSKKLELLKQKGAYPYEYMDSLVKKNYLLKNVFTYLSLREKCPNTEFFLFRIFMHWD